MTSYAAGPPEVVFPAVVRFAAALCSLTGLEIQTGMSACFSQGYELRTCPFGQWEGILVGGGDGGEAARHHRRRDRACGHCALCAGGHAAEGGGCGELYRLNSISALAFTSPPLRLHLLRMPAPLGVKFDNMRMIKLKA